MYYSDQRKGKFFFLFFQIYRTVSVQEKAGELTVKLNTFLSAMGEGGGGTLNPKPVFSEICRK